MKKIKSLLYEYICDLGLDHKETSNLSNAQITLQDSMAILFSHPQKLHRRGN
jgi:hypothetical protein